MSIISKKRYGLFIIVAALILNLFIFKDHVKASTITSLKFGSTVSGSITDNNGEQVYKINVPKSGRVTINFNSYIHYGVDANLKNSEGTEIWSNYSYGIGDGDENNPNLWKKDFDLEADTYYFHITKHDKTGKYNLKVNYTSAGSNEKEPNNIKEKAQQIDFDTQTVVGFISETDNDDYYKIILPKAGRITINLNSYIHYGVDVNLKNSEGTEIWSNYSYGIGDGDENNPNLWKKDFDLEADTYYFHITKHDKTGKYNLKVNYTSAGNNEKEPNDGIVNAQQISINSQMTGFISETDKDDYYKIDVPNSGKVILNIKSYINYGVFLFIKNSEGNNIWGDTYTSFAGLFGDNPGEWEKSFDLNKGIYYIHINKNYSTGKYILNVKCPSLIPGQPSVNEVNNKSMTVSGKTIANGTVTVKVGIKTYTGKSNSKGIYSIKIPTQLAGTKLYVSVKNGYGYSSSTKTVTVLDRIAPSAPTVNTITTSSKTVTGKTEGYATVIAYVGNKQIGTAKADKNGNYSIKIVAQKVSTKVSVVAVDGSRNRSTARINTVALIPGQPSVNEVNNKSTIVSGKTIANGTVTVKVGNKTYTGKSNSKGVYSIKIQVQAAGTKVYITVKNGYGYSSSAKTVTVLDRIAPSAPAVNTITTSSTTVTGKTEGYATVIAYVGNKQIGTAKADKNGNYSIKIVTQKVSTKVSVVAVDGSKNRSTAKVNTVALIPGQPLVNEVNNKSTIVSGKTIGSGTVTVKVGNKTYTGKSNSKGAFSIKIPAQSAGTKVYVNVKNGYGYSSSTKTVTVLDRIAPSAPIVNAINIKSKVIAGKTEGYAKVISYVGSKQIGTAKADKNGNYSIKIAAQKVGTKINVVSVDGSNNKSTARANTVKK